MSGGRTLLWALTTLIAGVSLVTKLLASARRSYDEHGGHDERAIIKVQIPHGNS